MFRESIRTDFLLESLKYLDIFACIIGNAYLNTKCSEKIWTEAGTEFGTEKGMVIIITREINGLKRSGAAWRTNLSETLKSLG